MCGLIGAGDEEKICHEDEAAAGEELPGEVLIGIRDFCEAGEPAGEEQRPCGGEDGFRGASK
jgi:hypothetical protein